jgi:hypothetical protein
VTAGLLTGLVAFVPTFLLAWSAGTFAAIAEKTSLHPLLAGAIFALGCAICGGLYGRVFMRAANDHAGGWLFGIGWGYLLWMLGPSTWYYWIWHVPLVTGRQGQGMFASFLVYGLALGVAFPLLHAAIQRRAMA